MKTSVEVSRMPDGRVGIFIDGGHMLVSEAQAAALRDKLNELAPVVRHAEAMEITDGWINDPDSIPSIIIETCRNAICTEFGSNGTDGYYKRILAKVFKATLSVSPSP